MRLGSTRLEEVCPRYKTQGEWVKPCGEDMGGARTVSKELVCRGACIAWVEAVKVGGGRGK